MSIHRFAELFGFERQILNALPVDTTRNLTLTSGVGLISCLLFGLSASYLAYLELQDQAYPVVLAALFGMLISVFVFNLQRLFITAGGFGLSRSLRDGVGLDQNGDLYSVEHLDHWQPDQLRLFCTFLLALIFSQPLLLLVNAPRLDQEIANVREVKLSAFEQDLVARAQQQRAELIIEQRTSLDKLSQSGFDITKLGSDPITLKFEHTLSSPGSESDARSNTNLEEKPSEQVIAPPNRPHKALVVGIKTYLLVNSLNNPTRDAQHMTQALKDLGYEVTMITDPKTTSMALATAIDAYLKSLQPGDISVFYFSGHGYMQHGTNYLAVSDTGKPGAININLAQLIDDISHRKPRASLIFLDACSSWANNAEKAGLGRLNQELKGTFVAYAASPGQYAIDLAENENGLFTKMLLKYIRQPKSIIDIMTLASIDVVNQTENTAYPQTPYYLGALQDVGLRLAAAPGYANGAVMANADVSASSGGDRSTANKSTDLCAVGQIYDTACLLARIELTAARINQADAETAQQIPQLINRYHDDLTRFGGIQLRLQYQWNHRWSSFFLSVIFIALLWAGDWVRDRNVRSLRQYERERYRRDRSFIRRQHHLYSRLTHASLCQYGSYRSDRRERIPLWNPEVGFFHEDDIQRPDHQFLAEELPQHSVQDLIDDLGGAPAR
jgi:hypothetical protein